MMNLTDLMAKATPSVDPKKRYKEYVIETQIEGKEPLTFKEWYELQK